MNAKLLNRRDFLKGAGMLGAFMLAGRFAPGGVSGLAGRAASAQGMDMFEPDAVINITAKEKYVQVFSGAQTRTFGYEGQLVTGSGVTVNAVPGSYLGPIIRAKSGTKVRINFFNQLPQISVIHPHGLNVPEECDGQPMQAIDPGQSKVYDFQVMDQACPAWFHPHPMMLTADQVAMGLAGLFYVTDDAEALAVPGAETGANDIPVIIQDRLVDSNNQWVYTPNQMWGYLGDRILVNGKPNTVFSLEPRGYRLRVLNGSNARTYKLAWSNGMKLTVIGSDGGLLPEPITRSYVMLMPGERVDLWADFSALAGRQVILKSLSFTPGMMGGGGGGMMGGSLTAAAGMESLDAAGMSGGGMGGGGCNCGGGGGGGMGGSSLANGAAFNILTVNVGRKATVKPALGPWPMPPMRFQDDPDMVDHFDSPVPFVLSMQRMVWTINGRVFEDMAVADDEMVTLDMPIAWEWINNSPIPHPMHIHDVQFQVVQRTPPSSSAYATVKDGFVDTGWKDTVSVWPGEKVKIAMKFVNYTGMYMYHCHILEHEDMGMMRNLMVMGEMGGM